MIIEIHNSTGKSDPSALRREVLALIKEMSQRRIAAPVADEVIDAEAQAVAS
jgi:hypothetical protein